MLILLQALSKFGVFPFQRWQGQEIIKRWIQLWKHHEQVLCTLLLWPTSHYQYRCSSGEFRSFLFLDSVMLLLFFSVCTFLPPPPFFFLSPIFHHQYFFFNVWFASFSSVLSSLFLFHSLHETAYSYIYHFSHQRQW